MAIVYRGRDTALDREVAVKLLHPHLAQAAESRARFSREARAVARLAHPSIVEIYDYAGDGAPEAYLVTEFIRGQTLRTFAQEIGFANPEAGLLIGRALADALAHAHSAGVIHRDLKPENVMVQEGDRPAVKLTDFGIARILASDERMTMTGALVGSPNHMAPEIVEGKEADERSDLFSLGTILYWLATGQLPFAASNPTATLRRAITGEFDDPRDLSAIWLDLPAGGHLQVPWLNGAWPRLSLWEWNEIRARDGRRGKGADPALVRQCLAENDALIAERAARGELRARRRLARAERWRSDETPQDAAPSAPTTQPGARVLRRKRGRKARRRAPPLPPLPRTQLEVTRTSVESAVSFEVLE